VGCRAASESLETSWGSSRWALSFDGASPPRLGVIPKGPLTTYIALSAWVTCVFSVWVFGGSALQLTAPDGVLRCPRRHGAGMRTPGHLPFCGSHSWGLET
jgi:hypothetical protein